MNVPTIRSDETAILGGGPAGLSAGYFMRQAGRPFHLYEAASRPGGNCATEQRGAFRFDTGAHRFHDKDAEMTDLIKSLMGAELKLVAAPSAIYSNGSFFDFPLSPLNLLRNLGLQGAVRATWGWLSSRASGRDAGNFESMAVGRYGHFLANRFLLNYSEKLWGLPAEALSTQISGGRLKGLTLKTFLFEGLFGSRKKTAHLDGAFYYPRTGYGAIADQLADACGRVNLSLDSRVTGIRHSHQRIEAVEINRGAYLPVMNVINTLPLPLFLRLMTPLPPAEILAEAAKLRFRDVMLVGLILDKPSVMPFATVYFPDPDYAFTRVYEPRNRSPLMSPPGKTSLIVEVPCGEEELVSGEALDRLVGAIRRQLSAVGWFSDSEVEDTFTRRLPFAYPMLSIGIEDPISRINGYLGSFDNLVLTGRNACFQYAHLHNMLKWGRDAADRIRSTQAVV